MAEVVKNVAESLDLETLQPEKMYVEVDGEKVYVKQFTFGNLLKAFRHLAALYSSLEGAVTVEQAILSALSQHGDDVIGLISLSTGKSKEFFDELDAVSGIDLAMMTYKVNEDFFTKHLIPKLQEMFPSDLQEMTEEEESQVDKATKKSKAKKIGSTSSKN